MATHIVRDREQVNCYLCHEFVNTRTWTRHMRRVHRLRPLQIRNTQFFAIIRRPFHEERD